MAAEPSFDLDAAGLRADRGDLATGVEVLARKLESALPAETRVWRRARSLFNREKVVEGLEVRLGTNRYRLSMRDGQPEAAREQEVRGVVIKREPLALGDWVQALGDELAREARTSASARSALERLMG